MMGNSAALWNLTLNRFREFYREPVAVFWVYGFPLILAMILGWAFQSRPVESIRVDIVSDGPGGSAAAEAVRETLAKDARLKFALADGATCRNRMRAARTDLVVTPPATKEGVPEYLVEPNRPEAVLARNAVDNILLRDKLPQSAKPTESTNDQVGGRYIDFLIPGLIGLNLMGGGLWGVGFVIVDMRVRKLLKRYLATPMNKSDFLLSLMLSRLVFTFVDIAILLGFAMLFFGIRIFGDPFALVVVMAVGGFSFAGIGLLAASRASTIETISGLMNAVMLPMYLLSGVFFSADKFPSEIQPLIQALPLTALINGLRAVMNDGEGFAAIVQPCLILTAWGVASFALALKLFRWR